MRIRTVAAVAITTLLLAACGGGDGSPTIEDAGSDSTTSSAPAGGDQEATTTTASPMDESTPTGTATIQATGAFTLDINGPGASCAYYFPAEERGLTFDVSSTDFPGTGEWSLHVQGDDVDTLGVLINTADTSFANDAETGNGTINAVTDPPSHVDFDLDLVNIVDHSEVTHVTGTIDC